MLQRKLFVLPVVSSLEVFFYLICSWKLTYDMNNVYQ